MFRYFVTLFVLCCFEKLKKEEDRLRWLSNDEVITINQATILPLNGVCAIGVVCILNGTPYSARTGSIITTSMLCRVKAVLSRTCWTCHAKSHEGKLNENAVWSKTDLYRPEILAVAAVLLKDYYRILCDASWFCKMRCSRCSDALCRVSIIIVIHKIGYWLW